MRHFVWASLVVVGVFAAACGGGNRPPMVPDAPDPALGDGGDAPAQPPAPSQTKK
jgi:hypothetical protein